MPAKVEMEFNEGGRLKVDTVRRGELWFLPLNDKSAGEKRLLVFWCHPEDISASFYKIPHIVKYPDPRSKSDIQEVKDLCSDDTFALSVASMEGIKTERFNDRDLGHFNLVLGHIATNGALPEKPIRDDVVIDLAAYRNSQNRSIS